MPDADAPVPATNTASAPQAAPSADKDPVGEELADHARIWRVYDQVARADDKERIDTWNRGLDNLALFAGLFSAVTTAFIIEAQKDLKVDYSQLAFLALNASANGMPFVQQPFVISSGARTITCLWVSSLLLSLSAALIAIMGKDWIGMYASRPVCNARQWAEMRTYRLLCVERWYMSGVIASAPVLLHVSLLLFGAGLVLFISSDPLTHHLTLGLALAAGGLYLVTTLSAMVFPASPFKSPATQMIRGALSATLRSLLFHPKRNLVANVHVAISQILAPDLNSISRDQRCILPMFLRQDTDHLTGEGFQCLSPLRRALDFVYTAPLSTWIISRYFLIDASRHMRPSNIAAAVRGLHIRPLFFISPWTDARSDRSPARLAKALSWLNSASLEPEVLRAMVIALGDFDIGGEVAPLVSADLRTRVRADIRFNWQKVDFVTLSRYVLADRNLPGQPLISYGQFTRSFDMEREPHLRCEDGLAAVVMVEKSYILAEDIRRYRPQVVSQSRVFHWLLPHISGTLQGYKALLDLIYYYRTLLSSRDVHDLEARFLQCFNPVMRDDYHWTVRTKFGNQRGLLELLMFLVVEPEYLDKDLATAAMDLVVHILTEFERIDGEHWCLAYLFSSDFPALLWALRSLTLSQAVRLLDSLPLWAYYRYKWGDRDAPPEPRRRQPLECDLARTIIEILSPARWDRSIHFTNGLYRGTDTTYGELCALCLHVQLCHSQSVLTDDDQITLVEHILEKAALLWIRDVRRHRYPHMAECCIDILTAIVHHLAPLLQSEVNQRRNVELFGLLARSEAHSKDGAPVIWDLGNYLRKMLAWISYEPSTAAGAIRRLLAELQALYPLCRESAALLAHWNRIGLPAAVDDWKYDTDEELVALFATRIEEVGNEPDNGGVDLPGAAGEEPEQDAVDLGAAGGEPAAARPAVPEFAGGDERDAIRKLYASII